MMLAPEQQGMEPVTLRKSMIHQSYLEKKAIKVFFSEECTNKGGASGGTCAEGFGVCCIMTLSCGDTTSDNTTYLVQSSVTSLNSPCSYTVCPCSNDICRIKYDFTTFVTNDPTLGTAVDGATTNLNGDAIGGCLTDQFSIASPGNVGSPVICGTNTGYHSE